MKIANKMLAELEQWASDYGIEKLIIEVNRLDKSVNLLFLRYESDSDKRYDEHFHPRFENIIKEYKIRLLAEVGFQIFQVETTRVQIKNKYMKQDNDLK